MDIDAVRLNSISSDQNRNILTIQDELTVYLIAVHIRDQTTEKIARHFGENVPLIYGCPWTLLTDCENNSLSYMHKEVCKLQHVKKIKNTERHPKTNGSLEHTHSFLIEFIWHFGDKDQSNWDR
jgi:hypothetical protein